MQSQIGFKIKNRQGTTKAIKSKVLRKDLRKQFYLIRCKKQDHKTIKKNKNNTFPFVKNAICNSVKLKIKLVCHNRFLCFISITKFGKFKSPFVAITTLLLQIKRVT